MSPISSIYPSIPFSSHIFMCWYCTLSVPRVVWVVMSLFLNTYLTSYCYTVCIIVMVYTYSTPFPCVFSGFFILHVLLSQISLVKSPSNFLPLCLKAVFRTVFDVGTKKSHINVIFIVYGHCRICDWLLHCRFGSQKTPIDCC